MAAFQQIFAILVMALVVLVQARNDKVKYPKLKKGIKVKGFNDSSFCEQYPELRSCQPANVDALNTISSGGCNTTGLLGMIKLPLGDTANSKETEARKKRSAGPVNPCADEASRKVLYYAFYEVYGYQVELVQNPSKHLYQTFYISECKDSQIGVPSGGYSCKMAQMGQKAAFWVGPNPDDIEVGVVWFDSMCVIHKDL